MKNTSLILLSVIVMAISGCDKSSFIGDFFRDNKAKPIVSEVENNLDDISSSISDETKKIDKETVNINKEADKISDPIYSEQTNNIKESSKKISDSSSAIKTNNEQIIVNKDRLSDAKKEIDNIEDFAKKSDSARIQAEKERDEAIKKADNATKNMLRWLIASCIIGIGASVAMMVFGNFRTGSIILVGCGAVLFFAVAVDKYLAYIAMAGLVLMALCVGVFIYQIIIRQKAVDEVTHTAEIAKTKMQPEDRKKLFGYREEPGIAFNIQSKSTEQLVEKARQKFKKSWEPTVPSTSMDEALKTSPDV